MKTYEIIEGKEWTLGKVTPKAVKMYRDMILESADRQEELEKTNKISDALRASVQTLDIFLETEAMLPWAEVVFDIPENDLKEFAKKISEGEYDYETYVRGFQDFLAKLSPLVNR